MQSPKSKHTKNIQLDSQTWASKTACLTFWAALLFSRHDQSVQKQELITMTNKPGKTVIKRLPKGQRTHVRRLKEEARKAGTVYKTNQNNLW
jgi:hypothetical protein